MATTSSFRLSALSLFSLVLLAILSFCVLAIPVSGISDKAANTGQTADEIQSLLSGTLNASFDVRQQAMINSINKITAKITSFVAVLESNDQIDPESVAVITTSLNNMVAMLESYKEDISTAASIEELKTINKEVKSYLIANKDVYKQNVEEGIYIIANNTYESALDLLNKAEQMLNIYKVKCPSQASTITDIQSQMNALEAEIGKLYSAMQEKDAVKMKEEIKAVADLSKSIVQALNELEQSCPITI